MHIQKFGEIYFTTIYPGIVKGWHTHTKMWLNYAVITGMIKIVLYDGRKESPTKGELMEIYIGDNNYALLIIPPRVTNGARCVGTKEAIIANCASEPHEEGEVIRSDPHGKDVPYDWALRDR